MPHRSQLHRQTSGYRLTAGSLSPFSGAPSAAITLLVNGSNFMTGDVIVFNGTPRTTVFVSAAQLSADITLPVTPGSYPVMVRRGLMTSNWLYFTVA